MENKIEFINSKHINNYLELLEKFPEKKEKDFDIALKLLSIEEVYHISKDYINEKGIKFKELLNDSRATKNKLFILELAYSLFSKYFIVKSISNTRKLDSDTRNFIIDIIYRYDSLQNKARIS